MAVSVGLHVALLEIGLRQDGHFLPVERYFVGLVTQRTNGFAPVDSAVRALTVAPQTVSDARGQPARAIRRRKRQPRVESGPGAITDVASQNVPSEKKQTLPLVDRIRDTGLELASVNDAPPLRTLLPSAGGESSAKASSARKNARAAAASSIAHTTRAKPRYADNPRPVYPAVARRKGWSGKVLLLVQVDKAGTVNRLSVNRTSGYSVLDRAARRAVRRWRFLPAMEAGRRVASEVVVPVDFRLPAVAGAKPLPLTAELK